MKLGVLYLLAYFCLVLVAHVEKLPVVGGAGGWPWLRQLTLPSLEHSGEQE